MSKRTLMLANCDTVRATDDLVADKAFFKARAKLGLLLSRRLGLTGAVVIDNAWMLDLLDDAFMYHLKRRKGRIVVYGVPPDFSFSDLVLKNPDGRARAGGFQFSSEGKKTLQQLEMSGRLSEIQRNAAAIQERLDGLLVCKPAPPDIVDRFLQRVLSLLNSQALEARLRSAPHANASLAIRNVFHDLVDDEDFEAAVLQTRTPPEKMAELSLGSFTRSKAYEVLECIQANPRRWLKTDILPDATFYNRIKRTVVDLAYNRQFEDGDELRLQDLTWTQPKLVSRIEHLFASRALCVLDPSVLRTLTLKTVTSDPFDMPGVESEAEELLKMYTEQIGDVSADMAPPLLALLKRRSASAAPLAELDPEVRVEAGSPTAWGDVRENEMVIEVDANDLRAEGEVDGKGF